MGFNDIKVIAMPGNTWEFKVDNWSSSSAARTIKAGDPVKESTNYVLQCSDDDVGATTDLFVGICSKESTETNSADGVCEVTTIIAMQTVLRGNAETSGSADTAAELLALLGDDFPFGATTEYTSTTDAVYSIAEDTDDGTNHGLHCIGGSGDSFATLDVIVKPQWLAAGQAA